MEWSNDDALELIEQYRSHTELWNRADPKYKDKLCRFRAWSEISERFGCSKAEVERKMNVLLTQYRREKHKMLVKLYQGLQPNPSKWYAFRRFDFMEAGGGSASLGLGLGRNSASRRNSSNAAAAAAAVGSGGGGGMGIGIGANGHANIIGSNNSGVMNGLTPFEVSPTSGTTTAHHRRLKNREMKYFSTMGLNLLMANTQNTIDNWTTSAAPPYSPPIGNVGAHHADRQHLRMPLSLPYAGSPADVGNFSSAATRSIYVSAGSAGGGSSNSTLTASPQKLLDNSTGAGGAAGSAADSDEREDKHERLHARGMGDDASGAGEGNTGEAKSHERTGSRGAAGAGGMSASGGERGSSPIPNTNLREAHKSARLLPHAVSGISGAVDMVEDELQIKQELVDYFHAPHPPPGMSAEAAAAAANRATYSSSNTDDGRLEFAQDLRVSAAAAAAAARGLDFSQFVLPARHMRPSTATSTSNESLNEEKYTPLNMRKYSSANAASHAHASAANTAAAAAAGQMLMNSLLSSNESLAEEAMGGGGGGRVGVNNVSGSGGKVLQDTSAASTSAAAAAAAALYAESLNRDDCDFIGSNVSLKLRNMDRTQRIIAEKLISEVLFYGQFNELERSARIQPK